MFDLIHEIMQAMGNNRLRTFLTGISVAWGIFMLIVLLAMSRGVFNAASTGFASRGANTVQVWGGFTSVPYKGYKQGRYIELKATDMEAVETQNPRHVADVSARINLKSGTISTTRDYVTAGLEGVYPAWVKTTGAKIVEGRFINDADIAEARKVVVIPVRHASTLFESPQQAVGSYVTAYGLSFKVVGVYDLEWGQTVCTPFTTAYKLAGYDDNVSTLVATIQNVTTEADGNQAEAEIRSTLSQLHEVNPNDQSAFWINNRFVRNITMNNGLGVLNIAIWVIGIFTLLSGIIGVSNIMFVSVKERTHEIGIRRAIGARPRQVLVQIILESVSITALFGFIGIFLGIVATEALNAAVAGADFLKEPRVDSAIALEVVIVLVVAGALAGLFPALRALKVKPVEALRDE